MVDASTLLDFNIRGIWNRRPHESISCAYDMGEVQEVAAYFDLDGTLLNASSEKTLTGVLARRRPWRIPHATIAWVLGATLGLLTGKAPYDALRNRGHLSLASWRILEQYSETFFPTDPNPIIPIFFPFISSDLIVVLGHLPLVVSS